MNFFKQHILASRVEDGLKEAPFICIIAAKRRGHIDHARIFAQVFRAVRRAEHIHKAQAIKSARLIGQQSVRIDQAKRCRRPCCSGTTTVRTMCQNLI